MDQCLFPLSIFWEEGRQRGNFIQTFLSQSSFKKTTVSEEDEEEQTTHIFFSDTQKERQAGRPSPTPRLYDPLQPLIDLVSLLVSHPQDGWGCGNRQATLHPHLDPYPWLSTNQDSREGGVRREEGLCIFLYLWQTAVLAWFKLSMEISTSQTAWNPQDASGATCPSEQPANQPVLWQGCPLPTTSQ